MGAGHDGVMQIGLVLDSRDPETLAPFWAAALGYVVVGAVDNYVMLVPDGREGPKLLLQRVPEHKGAKNRMHLDIEVVDIEYLAEKLEALGGTRLEADAHSEHGMRWIVMADPEGNEFCVCDAASC
jgi:predicted enzyme related to lactoylglutathione lyase